MFRRRPVQDKAVSLLMRRVFASGYMPRRPSSELDNAQLEAVGLAYGRMLLPVWTQTSRQHVLSQLSRTRFTIALSTADPSASSFEHLTKKTTLISDTLLLSHDWTGRFHDLNLHWSEFDDDFWKEQRAVDSFLALGADDSDSRRLVSEFDAAIAKKRMERRAIERSDSVKVFGMHCPDIVALGRWALDAKLLLKAGLVWYLPSFSFTTRAADNGRMIRQPVENPDKIAAVDYLIRDGRAVDASGAEPIKSRLVRPILQVELPFIEGMDLREFSKITVNEFVSYAAFRDFLRFSFLDMDAAMDATESDRELVKLSLQIKDQVRAASADLMRVRRKRAVSATGAVVGSVGAILVAVYGPALAAAVAVVGAGGGLWGVINAVAENNTREQRGSKWHYVWVLARKNDTHFL